MSYSTSRQQQIKVVGGYALHERLGAGSFATVYKGIKVSHTSPGADTVAVKAITRTSDKLTKKVLQNLEIEISIHRRIAIEILYAYKMFKRLSGISTSSWSTVKEEISSS